MAQFNKPTDYFNTVLYSGTGSNQSITGVGFQPDLIWGKGRTLAGYDHRLVDIVRGNTKLLKSNSADAEETQTTEIQSFDSDGFTVGTGSRFNNASQTYVAWNWLASNTTASNTDGSITSTVSANTTSGFSIVKYTGNGTSGATIGHGLGSVPKVMFIRTYDATAGFQVYHVATGNTKFAGYLNTTETAGTTAGAWNNTTPTSSVFTVGNGGNTNTNGGTHIAYCFAEKKGFSKIGSFEGNNNSDGTFVYLGFKPAWVMIKDIDSQNTVGGIVATSWGIWDNKRMPNNTASNPLWANNNGTETIRGNNSSANTGGSDGNGLGGFINLDMLSNGFKCRAANSELNDAQTYIYMAFAESPLVGTNNIPATAR